MKYFFYSPDYQFITKIYMDTKKPPDEKILGRCLNKGVSVLFQVGPGSVAQEIVLVPQYRSSPKEA